MNNSVYFSRLSIIILLIVSLLGVNDTTYAQKENIGIPFKSYLYLQPNVGASQYFGEFNKEDLWNQHQKLGFGAILGYQLSPIFGLRGQFVKDNLYSKRFDQEKLFTSDLWDGALHLTININEIFAEYNSKRFFNFYVFTGAGISSFKSKVENFTTHEIINEHTTRQSTFVLPVGAGAAIRLNNTFSVNLEYGDRTVFSDVDLDLTSGGNKKNHDHYSYTSVGLQISFGLKDTDGDGIRDKEDLCPDTPKGVKVDDHGCPIDTDKDGVADYLDKCPNTPSGVTVDEKGCPVDSDNDGVADYLDKCPDTPAGVIVDTHGCPVDADKDGVADYLDKCPNTPAGVSVDADGCPLDTDKDGVPDYLDKCPDTPAGVSVDANGCPPVPEAKFEYFKVVYFNFDKTVLVAKFIKDLDEVVAVLIAHPNLNLSIEGYADSQGPSAYNLKLSEKRADFVINYLIKKGIAKERLAKSYFGETKPAATNKTMEGRAKNRRVEIKSIK